MLTSKGHCGNRVTSSKQVLNLTLGTRAMLAGGVVVAITVAIIVLLLLWFL